MIAQVSPDKTPEQNQAWTKDKIKNRNNKGKELGMGNKKQTKQQNEGEITGFKPYA